jgi:hypothetical protein
MEGTSYDALSRAPDRDAFQRALLKRLHLLTSTLSGATAQRCDLPVLYRSKVERLAEALNEPRLSPAPYRDAFQRALLKRLVDMTVLHSAAAERAPPLAASSEEQVETVEASGSRRSATSSPPWRRSLAELERGG